MKKRVIAFLRVSTEEQADEDRAGIPRQRESIRLTANARNLQIVDEVVLTDVSGSNVRRSSAFQDILQQVSSRSIDGVVVSDLDRLIRPNDLADLEVLDVFHRAGAVIYTEGAIHDFRSIEGTLLSQVIALFAGYERRLILKRIIDAKEEKRRRGKCPSSRITLPLGINYHRETEQWGFTSDIAKVQEAFRLVDEEGQTNISTIGGLVGIASRTLWNILRNPIYMGMRVYARKRGDVRYRSSDGKQADRKKIDRSSDQVIQVKVYSEPAVSSGRFSRVQSILDGKTSKWRTQRRTIEVNLGVGIAQCAHCGRKLYASSGRRASGHRTGYYFCAANHYLAKRNGSSCVQPNVRKDHLDETLLAFVSNYLSSEDIISRLIERVSKPIEQNVDPINERIADLQRKRSRYIELFTDGVLDKSEFTSKLNRTDRDIADQKNLLVDKEKRSQAHELASRNMRLLAKACIAFKALSTKREQQVALRSLFRAVIFDGDKIVKFLPLVFSGSGRTENGSHVYRDSWPR